MRSPRALRAAERPATRSPGHQEGPDLRGPVVRQARQSASGERSGYPAVRIARTASPQEATERRATPARSSHDFGVAGPAVRCRRRTDGVTTAALAPYTCRHECRSRRGRRRPSRSSPISQLSASSAGRRRGRSGRSPGFPRQQGACASSLVCPHLTEDADVIGRPELPWFSPNSGIAVSSTVRPSGGIGERACFAEVAGVAEVLAGGPIGGDLQAHLAVPRVAEWSPGPAPGSLLARTNLAPPLTRISVCWFSRLRKVVSEAVVRLRDGRQIRTIRTTGGVDRAREVTAGSIPIYGRAGRRLVTRLMHNLRTGASAVVGDDHRRVEPLDVVGKRWDRRERRGPQLGALGAAAGCAAPRPPALVPLLGLPMLPMPRSVRTRVERTLDRHVRAASPGT